MEFSINCGGLTDERRASAGANAASAASTSGTASAGVPAGAAFGSVMTSSAGNTTTTNTTSSLLTTNHGSKDSRGKQPMAGVGASLANVLTDPSPPPPHNYPYDIKKIRVCVVAESSDVASSIPG